MIALLIIALPLALLIYLTMRLLKRPITPIRSAGIAVTVVGAAPNALFVLVLILSTALLVLLSPVAFVAWAFHISWLTSWFDWAPTWLGVPSVVWFGGLILIYWAAQALRFVRGWLRAQDLMSLFFWLPPEGLRAMRALPFRVRIKQLWHWSFWRASFRWPVLWRRNRGDVCDNFFVLPRLYRRGWISGRASRPSAALFD